MTEKLTIPTRLRTEEEYRIAIAWFDALWLAPATEVSTGNMRRLLKLIEEYEGLTAMQG